MKKLIFMMALILLFAKPSFASVNIGNGTKTITTSGTALALTSTSQYVNTLVVCADIANTGYVVIGSAPVAASGSQQGIVIPPGGCAGVWSSEKAQLDISTVKADVTVNGEKASYFWEAEA